MTFSIWGIWKYWLVRTSSKCMVTMTILNMTLTYISMFQCPHIICTISTHQGCKTKRFQGYNDKFFLFWCNTGKDRYMRQNLIKELSMMFTQECQALRKEDHDMTTGICYEYFHSERHCNINSPLLSHRDHNLILIPYKSSVARLTGVVTGRCSPIPNYHSLIQ